MEANFDKNIGKISNTDSHRVKITKKAIPSYNSVQQDLPTDKGASRAYFMGGMSFKGSVEGSKETEIPDLSDEEFEALKKEIEKKVGSISQTPQKIGEIRLNKQNISIINRFLDLKTLKDELAQSEDIAADINYISDLIDSKNKISLLKKILDNPEIMKNEEQALGLFCTIGEHANSKEKAQILNKILDNEVLYTNASIIDSLDRILESVDSKENADLKCQIIDKILSNEGFLGNNVAMEHIGRLIASVNTKNQIPLANKIIDNKNLYGNKNIFNNLFNVFYFIKTEFHTKFMDKILDHPEFFENQQLPYYFGIITNEIDSEESLDAKFEIISKIANNKELNNDDKTISIASRIVRNVNKKSQAKVGIKIIENPILRNNKKIIEYIDKIFQASDTDKKADRMCNLIDKIINTPEIFQTITSDNICYTLQNNDSEESIQAKIDFIDTVSQKKELLKDKDQVNKITRMFYCINSQAGRSVAERILNDDELLNSDISPNLYYAIKTEAQARLAHKILDYHKEIFANTNMSFGVLDTILNADTEEKSEHVCKLIDRIYGSQELQSKQYIRDSIHLITKSEDTIRLFEKIIDTPEFANNVIFITNFKNIMESAAVRKEAADAKIKILDRVLEQDGKLLQNDKLKTNLGIIVEGVTSEAHVQLANRIFDHEELINNTSIMTNLKNIFDRYDKQENVSARIKILDKILEKREVLLKNESIADKLGAIISSVHSDDDTELKCQIIDKILNNPEFDTNSVIMKNIAEIIMSVRTKEDVENVYNFINKVKDNPDFINLSSNDILFGASLFGLYKAKNINEIPIGEKKSLLKALVSNNIGLFKVSEAFQKMFPLVPRNTQEYCKLLPQLAKSIGIEGKDLSNEEIKEFNKNLVGLSNSLTSLSDSDFNNLEIKQSYSKDKFIKDTLDIVSKLDNSERQKVYDYFGFELKESENSSVGYTIIGYPKNINNGEKLAQIKDENTKAVVEELRKKVIAFSENNNISVSGNNELADELNGIVKAFPELRTMIEKPQHKTHDFDLMKHSLKVIQNFSKNPDFNKLNDSDKRLMILAGLFHDITKREGMVDKTHAKESAFDASYLVNRLDLNQDEEFKLHNLISNHEWLEYANKGDDTEKRLMDVAYDFRFDNSFDMAMMFTKADLLAVKKDNSNGNIFATKFMDKALSFEPKIKENIEELKKTQPLLPVTKIPKASVIERAITVVNDDGSTNIKGVYKDKKGLIVIKFNEVKDWEALGFPKGTTSRSIKTTTSKGDEVDTGNIHFFAHGLDYPNQLIKFDAFSMSDSDALLSVSYAERPESKYRFFRPQGVLLDCDTKYIHGGGNTDSGSGYSKDIQDFKDRYISKDADRYEDRIYISNLIKERLKMNDEEYIQFVKENENKQFSEIEPKEIRDEIIKVFAEINSNVRTGNRSYNEMYISNPRPPMAVFAYEMNEDEEVKNPIEFLNQTKGRSNFLQDYARERDIPFIVFGD